MIISFKLELNEKAELGYYKITCSDKKEFANMLLSFEKMWEEGLRASPKAEEIEEWLGSNEYILGEYMGFFIKKNLEEMLYNTAFTVAANVGKKVETGCKTFFFRNITWCDEEVLGEEEDLTATSKKGGEKC